LSLADINNCRRDIKTAMEFIMKKMSFFLIGMTSLMLAFGMIGGDTGTNTVTKEVPVAGPGSTTTVEIEGASFASDEAALAGYLSEGDPRTKPIYVVDDFEVKGNLTVLAKKTIIIITDDAAIREKAVKAGVTPKGSNVPQNRGVLFAIGEQKTTTPTLTVKGSLTVASGGAVVLGSETNATYGGVLVIEGGGKVLVTPKGTVTATVSSEIELKDATSSTFSFEGTSATLKVVGTINTSNNESVVGTEKAIIVIPNTETTPDLTIVAGNVTIGEKQTTDAEVGGPYTGSTKTVSGGSLDDVKLEEGKTLIVSGNSTASKDLEVPEGGTLEIAGNLTTSEELTVAGGGTLKVDGSLTTSGELTVENGGTLEITTGASIDLGTTGTITGAGTINNQGTIKTATEDGAALGAILGAAAGTIEATGDVEISSSDTVNVQAETDLTLAGEVTIEGKLDLSALFTPPTETVDDVIPSGGGKLDGKVELEGELVVESGGTLRLSTGNGSDLPPEIDWTAGGSLTIAKGGKIELATGVEEQPTLIYIGDHDDTNALYQWNEGSTGGSITLSDGKMEFSGKITAANLGGSIGESITATVMGTGSEFTVGEVETAYNYYEVKGTLVIEDGATLKVSSKKAGGGGDTELHLRDSSSRLVVRPSGTVDVTVRGVISDTDEGTPRRKRHQGLRIHRLRHREQYWHTDKGEGNGHGGQPMDVSGD
jgi:hypothetical protein